MKATSRKAINPVLLILLILAVVFAAAMVVMYLTFSSSKYEQQIADIQAQTLSVKSDTEAEEAAIDAERQAAEADISVLGDQGTELQTQLTELQTENESLQAELDEVEADIDLAQNAQERMNEMRHEYGAKIREFEELVIAGKSNYKIAYWTLDDGPSYHTTEFLDYAAEEGIYLTFFCAHDANDSPDERSELRAEALGGHSLCNHTYSHMYSYGNVYFEGIDSFKEQIQKQTDWIYECTGITTDIFRFPGGRAWGIAKLSTYSNASAEEVDAALEELGMKWIDWNCNSYDAGTDLPDASTESANIVYEFTHLADQMANGATPNNENICILLSHDWNENTFNAMKIAVPKLKEEGFVFLPLFSESWTMENTTIAFT